MVYKKNLGFVTFLVGAGDYINGVICLAKSLQTVNSSFPLVVAIGKDVPGEHREILISHGCIVREIEPVLPPAGSDKTKFAMAYYVINYSKLRIWEFDDFDRLVYLDADMVVLENIDHLLTDPDPSFKAVMDCFCEPTWSHSPQYSIGYCQQEPHNVKWTLSTPKPPLYFNAGMFVFQPSKKIFDDMMKRLRSNPPTLFAEQDFLNSYFEKSYKPIPLEYNLVLAMLWRHPENLDISKVKVVHYCAKGSKPWRFDPTEENMDREDVKMLVKKWWDIFESPTLALPSKGDIRIDSLKARVGVSVQAS